MKIQKFRSGSSVLIATKQKPNKKSSFFEHAIYAQPPTYKKRKQGCAWKLIRGK